MAASDLLVIPGSGVMASPRTRRFVMNIRDQALLAAIQKAVPGVVTKRSDQGSELVVVPMHEDVVAILHNLGCNTLGMGPLNFLYDRPLIEGLHIPMPHQVESAAFAAVHPRSYDLSTMRTGKTGSKIMSLDYLVRRREIGGAALVVAPLSTLETVWYDGLTSTLPDCRAVVLYGSKAERKTLLQQNADYFIINPDGLKLIEDQLTEAVRTRFITKVVFDELTIFGNAKSGRWKAANNIVNGEAKCEYVAGLTGTPGGNPRAVYGMTKLVTPWTMPADRQSVWDDLCYSRWGTQVWQMKERPEAQHLIHQVMQPAIRFDKRDVMPHLPPVLTTGRDAQLTPTQQKFCRKIITEQIALTESGEVVEATNKAAAIGKYFQAAQGMVIADHDELVPIDSSARVDLIEEVIKESEAKVVIFCCYTGVIDKLVSDLKGRGYEVAKVDGSVTGRKRSQIFRDFQDLGNKLRILVAHPETVAFGVELAAADTIIFNGPPRVGTFKVSQALERLSSIKQQSDKIMVVNVAATPEERKSFQDIAAGISQSESVNMLFTSWTKTGRRR